MCIHNNQHIIHAGEIKEEEEEEEDEAEEEEEEEVDW